MLLLPVGGVGCCRAQVSYAAQERIESDPGTGRLCYGASRQAQRSSHDLIASEFGDWTPQVIGDDVGAGRVLLDEENTLPQTHCKTERSRGLISQEQHHAIASVERREAGDGFPEVADGPADHVHRHGSERVARERAGVRQLHAGCQVTGGGIARGRHAFDASRHDIISLRAEVAQIHGNYGGGREDGRICRQQYYYSNRSSNVFFVHKLRPPDILLYISMK